MCVYDPYLQLLKENKSPSLVASCSKQNTSKQFPALKSAQKKILWSPDKRKTSWQDLNRKVIWYLPPVCWCVSACVCLCLWAGDQKGDDIPTYVFCSSSSSFRFIMATMAWRSSTAEKREKREKSQISAFQLPHSQKTHKNTHNNMLKLISESFLML